MMRRDPAGEEVSASSSACPRTSEAACPVSTEREVAATNAVVKVQYKDEVLRFRVAWPLDIKKLRSDVFTTLQSPGPCDRSEVSSISRLLLLYHSSKGKLLELSDGNAADFAQWHDPADTIRLRAVLRSPASCAEEPRAAGYEPPEACEVREGGADDWVCPPDRSASTSADGEVEAAPRQDTGAAAAAAPDASNVAESATLVSACPASSTAPTAPDTVDPEPEAPTVGTDMPATVDPEPEAPHQTLEDFLGNCNAVCLPGQSAAASSKQSPGKTSTTKGGISLPIAAKTAAYALSDVLENARDRLSEALSAQEKPSRPPQNSTELQRALRESEEMQQAIEASAAESRKRLAKVLDLYQLRLRPVEADGNCQFRALSVQICGDESRHAVLREVIVKQLQERRERYEGYMLGSFEEYLERMARDGEWGDNVTLQAASDVLNCEIHVLTDQPGSELLELRPEKRPESESEDSRSLQQALCLAFLTEVHYDAVVIETA